MDNILEYDSMTAEGKLALCREYMFHVEGWKLFEDWILTKGFHAVETISGKMLNRAIHEHLTEYCEQLESFFVWLDEQV